MRKFWKDVTASAIGFIISMVVVAILVSSLVTTIAANLWDAANNSSLTVFVPGGAAMMGIIGLMFVVIPVLIFAKAAR